MLKRKVYHLKLLDLSSWNYTKQSIHHLYHYNPNVAASSQIIHAGSKPKTLEGAERLLLPGSISYGKSKISGTFTIIHEDFWSNTIYLLVITNRFKFFMNINFK